MSNFWSSLALTLIDKLAIAVIIAFTVYYLNRLLEKYRAEQVIRSGFEALRNQTALRHLERQVEELYSPLLGLLQYGEVVNRVEFQKNPQSKRDQSTVETRRFFAEEYYLPLNAQISSLIRSKIYLLASDAMPESFQQFLLHAAQYECLYKLWKERDVKSDDIPGIEFPPTFREDVQADLASLRERHGEYLKRLEIQD